MCQSTACVCVFLCVCASTVCFRSDGGGRGGVLCDGRGGVDSKERRYHTHTYKHTHTHTQKGSGDHETDAAKRVLLVPSNCSLFQAMIPKLHVAPEPLAMHLLLLLD